MAAAGSRDRSDRSIQNGVALYSGEPLRRMRWAITVHDAAGPPVFRSGPLHRLPGSFLPSAFGTRIAAFRASGGGSFGLDSEDGFSDLLRQRLAQLPSAIRVENVQLTADNAGHEVVVVTGELRRFFFLRVRFSYSLALTIRPGTHPGRPQEIVIVEPVASGRVRPRRLSRLDQATSRASAMRPMAHSNGSQGSSPPSASISADLVTVATSR